MARYSREQRRRAVELYERYGHSAADVIRELGYPSKGALLMWYREWLEERRTGVPSRRGERYARYTVFLVKLVFRFSSGIFFGFGRGCAGRVCFIGFGVCRT